MLGFLALLIGAVVLTKALSFEDSGDDRKAVACYLIGSASLYALYVLFA